MITKQLNFVNYQNYKDNIFKKVEKTKNVRPKRKLSIEELRENARIAMDKDKKGLLKSKRETMSSDDIPKFD